MLDALKDRDAEIARHHADFERWETMADDAVKRAATAVRRAETAEEALNQLLGRLDDDRWSKEQAEAFEYWRSQQ